MINALTAVRRSPYHYAVLLVIFLLYAANLYRLIVMDSDPPMWDEAVHLKDSLVYYRVITDPFQLNATIIREIVNLSDNYPLLRPSGYYPPLVAMAATPSYLVLGQSLHAALVANFLFVAIFVASLYGLTARVFDRNTGVLAVVLGLTLPAMLHQSLDFMLDMPLTAMVGLSFLTLLKTDAFRNRKWSVIAGVCMGLGMLTKWTFAFFVAGPVAYLVVVAAHRALFVQSEPRFWRAATNPIICALAALVTFGPYYFPILGKLIEETMGFSDGPIAQGPESLVSLQSLAFYPIALWDSLITPAGVVLLLLGILFLLRSRNDHKLLIAVSALIPYCVFTLLIANKQARYMLPWLVFLLPVMAFAFTQLWRYRKRANWAVTAGCTVLLLAMGWAFVQKNTEVQDRYMQGSSVDWEIGSMISALAADHAATDTGSGMRSGAIYVGVIPDHHYINNQTLRYYAALRELPMTFIKLENWQGTSLQQFREQFPRYDYIVTKDAIRVDDPAGQESVDSMHAYFESRRDEFMQLAAFDLPDSSSVTVFVRHAGGSD